MTRLLEDNIKQALLQHSKLFGYLGDLGATKVVYEKTIDNGKTIADALVFTENQGLIGVEIKTEYDNLKRLAKQLHSYLAVCNYVFVFCHDSQVDKVKALLKRNNFVRTVGIISYTEFNNEVIAGLEQKAHLSKYFQLSNMLNSLLWRQELRKLLATYYNKQFELLDGNRELVKTTSSRSSTNYYGGLGDNTIPNSFNKRQLILLFLKTFNTTQGIMLVCRFYICGKTHLDKKLQIYNFDDKFTHDRSY